MTALRCFSSRMTLACLAATALFLNAVPTHANVIGSDMQNFNATTSGLDFVTVHSSETLKPGIINLGAFLNYAVNTLPYFDNPTPQSKTRLNDGVLGLDLNFGIGLTRGWDIGFSFPMILSQTVDDTSGARGEFASTGASEIRANTKVRLYGDDSGGIAAVASMNVNRIENNAWLGKDAGPIFNLELVADTSSGPFAYGANIGYRFRSPGKRLLFSRVEPLKDQMIASAAISYHIPDWSTKFIGEVFGSLPAQSTTSQGDRTATSLEALAGVKHDATENLALHAGAGIGAISGVASPDYRVYTGLNYTFGPLWGRAQLSDPPPPPDRYLVQVPPPPAPPAPAPAPAPVERFRTQSILFEFDSDRMIGNYHDVLTELANYLRGGFRELVVEGHTDSIGAASYNQRLSKRRAEAIRRYMGAKFGIPGSKIRPIGYGESRPIADNGNYQGRQQNRRVEFEIKR